MARARVHEPLRPVTRPPSRSPRTRARANPNPSAFGYEPGDADSRPNRGGPPPWALRLMRKGGSRRLATLVAALIGVGLIIGMSGVRVDREGVGYVGVVRNGGPLDTRTIRQILMPGQHLTWIGFFSERAHDYPASNVNRTYTLTSDPRRGSRPGVDVVTVPTKDGVQIGVEATVFMRFVGERDLEVLKRFDISYGTRRFRPAGGGKSLFPWQGDDGFYAWLDNLFRPVLEYNLRREVGRYDCAQLVASCALVSSGRSATGSASKAPVADSGKLADRLSSTLQSDLTRTLGQPYFWNIRMRIARVTLPKGVQSAVDDAQAKYVQVNGAKAELAQARYQRERNRLLGEAYNASPALANIDALKALPKQATVILSTNGRTPAVLATPGNGSAAAPAETNPAPAETNSAPGK
jgi:regulator of protease activity HflC (stomatin/prohibitin superfamily)